MTATLKSIFACAIINFLLVSQDVLANPSGAPGCAANVQAITGAMGAPTGELGYVINPASTSYTPGTAMNIQITNPNPAITNIKGILLYVMPEADNQKRVGTWVVPPTLKDNSANCGAIKSEPLSVLTHTDSTDKPLLNVDFVWTPGAELTGNMLIRCMVVGKGPANWQVLDQIVLTPGAPVGGGNAAGAPAAPIVAAPGGGKRKCRTYRHKTPALGGAASAPPVSPAAPAPTTALDASAPIGGASAAPIGGTSAAPIGGTGSPSTDGAPPPADPASPPPADSSSAAPTTDGTSAIPPTDGTSSPAASTDGTPQLGQDAASADVALEQSTDPNADPNAIVTASGSSKLWQAPYTLCITIAVLVLIQ